MKKALAQNPNLLRTLIGLSLTLIFLLSYAVYGATVSPSVYMYKTAQNTTTIDESDASFQPTRYYDEVENTTSWIWQATVNPHNLTWLNVTGVSISSGGQLSLTNSGYLYSHEQLGQPVSNQLQAIEFSCEVSCYYNQTHQQLSQDGTDITIHTLTSTDPARRSNGSIFAKNLEEAWVKADQKVNYSHSSGIIIIEILESGNRTTSPTVEITSVNEELISVEVFSVDTATEFLWALAAVIGFFSMILVPSFTVYFAARAKEKRNQSKVNQADIEVYESISIVDEP